MEIKLENEKQIIENGDNGIFNSINDMKTYKSHLILNEKEYTLKYTFGKGPSKLDEIIITTSTLAPLLLSILDPKFLLMLVITPIYFTVKYYFATKKVKGLIATLRNKIESYESISKENNNSKTNDKTLENNEVDKFIVQIINAMRIAKEAKYDGYMQDIIDLKKLSNDYIEYNIEEKNFGEVNLAIDIDWYKRLTDIEERMSQNMKNYKYKLQNTNAINQEFEDTILNRDLILDNPFYKESNKSKILKNR